MLVFIEWIYYLNKIIIFYKFILNRKSEKAIKNNLNDSIIKKDGYILDMKSIEFSDAYGHFAHLLPKGQEWFSPKEVGHIIGRSDQFVRNCFYSGKIFGHQSNGLAGRGEEKKTYMRVHKDALVIFLLETANYTPESFMEALENLIRNRSDYQLMRLEKIIKERLYSTGIPRRRM